ncbi:predicted protein, partial [Nematostella vectensis]
RRLIIATLFCVVFIACEVTGGVIANSLAVMNDALHQLFDLNSLLASLLAAWIAGWKPNSQKTYGYFRAEILGACLVILMLWLLTGVLVYEALLRLLAGTAMGHSDHVNADVMMITAGFTCAANIVLAFMLSGVGRHHHSHGSYEKNDNCEGNINIRAAFLHTIGDIIYAFGVLLAGLIIKIKPEWQKADAICSLVGAVIVLVTTYAVIRDSFNILFEGVPRDVRIAEVKRDLSTLHHVVSFHNVHVWALTSGRNLLTAHLVVEPEADTQTLLKIASKRLSSKYSLYHCTLQLE